MNYYTQDAALPRTPDDEALLAAFREVGPRLQAFKHEYRNGSSHFTANTFPVNILTSSQHVRSLSLPLGQQQLVMAQDHLLRFDQLEELSISLQDKTNREPHLAMLTSWYLPCLGRLAFYCYCSSFILSAAFCRGITGFVKVHGTKIRQMVFRYPALCGCANRPHLREPHVPRTFRSMVRLCPSLEYLALPSEVMYMDRVGHSLYPQPKSNFAD